MTLGTLVLYIGIVALVFTIAIGMVKKGQIKWILSYLQNFCGVLFCFSGYVKAIDPMGTAFKMEQYFAEFEATASGTWLDFLVPMFPWLSGHAIGFSVFMIVLEIVVGLMLILGHKPKFTAWVFFITLVFFTGLTGFTFLTGYVPAGSNFFSFPEWGSYMESNMRVTDCGCFGDFIKLEPRTSFFKDVVLMIPAILFVLYFRKMHDLFSDRVRNAVVLVAIAGLVIFSLSNYLWALPIKDFRPFKEGVDIYATKMAEEEAAGSVQIIAWKLRNLASGEVVELPNDEYMSNYKSYPKEEWEIVDQVKSEPAIERTKISDFEITASDGTDMTADILESESPLLMIVCYKLKGDVSYVERERIDSIYRPDTITTGDSIVVERVLDRVDKSMETVAEYDWDDSYIARFTQTLKPVIEGAANEGVETFVVAGGADASKIESFSMATGLDIPVYEADDILLKTIIRSNPGVVLMESGTIVRKWHIAKLPSWDEMRQHLQ